jgi:hypothetical protein
MPGAKDRRERDVLTDRRSGGKGGSDLQRQAEEARKKLGEAKQRADETFEHAAEKLRDLTVEQEANAERLRREARELPGSLPPEAPKSSEDEREGT